MTSTKRTNLENEILRERKIDIKIRGIPVVPYCRVKKAWVKIGGEPIYSERQAMNYATKIYLILNGSAV